MKNRNYRKLNNFLIKDLTNKKKIVILVFNLIEKIGFGV